MRRAEIILRRNADGHWRILDGMGLRRGIFGSRREARQAAKGMRSRTPGFPSVSGDDILEFMPRRR